jgi:hypothetical protein
VAKEKHDTKKDDLEITDKAAAEVKGGMAATPKVKYKPGIKKGGGGDSKYRP